MGSTSDCSEGLALQQLRDRAQLGESTGKRVVRELVERGELCRVRRGWYRITESGRLTLDGLRGRQKGRDDDDEPKPDRVAVARLDTGENT